MSDDEEDAPERSENEQFYDDVVAPAILALSRQCEERGIGFVATVEYDHGDFGSTINLPAQSSDGCMMAYIAARSHGNIDSMVFNWVKLIRQQKRPHGSIVMKQLGLALNPEDR